jgi:hypothetical protein
MAINDYSKWLNHAAWQPQNMTALLVLLGQGKFVLEDIMPVVQSSDNFQWLTEVANDGFLLSRKRGERGAAEQADLYDAVLTGSAYEYFVKAEITAKNFRANNVFSFINVLVRKQTMLANKLRLSFEKDGIDALLDTTTYPTINVVTASVAWSTYATSDPYKYVQLAKNKILTTEYIEPDIIVIGANDKTDMSLSEALRDSVQYTENYNENGDLVSKIAGLDIKLSTAIYKTIGQTGTVTSTEVLNGKAIVTKKGLTGEIREAQPYDSYQKWNDDIKVLNLYASRVAKPIVTKPSGVSIIVI